MNIKRIYAISLRQTYLIKDNSMRFFQMFVWVGLDVILWGIISRYLGGAFGSGLNFIPVLLGAVLLWDFSGQVMQGVTISFFEDVWSNNFLNLFGSPLKISEYITGLVTMGIARGIVTLMVMILLATLIFGFPVFIYGASIALFLLILFLFGIALGIIGVSIVLRFGPSAEWLVWPIPAIIAPFVGVFYPHTVLPQWMQYVGRALPPSYVFTGIRDVVAGRGVSATALVGGAALAILYVAISYMIFARVYKRAVRTGLITRYSAESL